MLSLPYRPVSCKLPCVSAAVLVRSYCFVTDPVSASVSTLGVTVTVPLTRLIA